MKDTLAFLLRHIVEHPDDIQIQESGDDARIVYTVTSHSEDMGKIIGKSGRIIRAIRDLMKVMATKHNTYVDVVLAEENQSQESKVHSND